MCLVVTENLKKKKLKTEDFQSLLPFGILVWSDIGCAPEGPFN